MRVMLVAPVAAVLLPAFVEAAPPVVVRQPVAPVSTASFATSRTIYLNRHGGTLRPGNNNSRTDTSSIVPQQVTMPGWNTDAATWSATVECMQEIWAPFGVVLTEEDPGQTPHIEARFGGSPASLGLPANVAGVSPMAIDCSIVENSIVFAFPDKLGNNPRKVCEVMSQEIGHSYGLDHELEPSDPMTYLPFSGERAFQDRSVACGESTARPCGIGGNVCRATQNSFQILRDRLGLPGADIVAPKLELHAPEPNATVEPGFTVVADASDNIGVASVNVFIDDEMVGHSTEMATDPTLEPGGHSLRIEATDAAGNTTTVEVGFRISEEAEPDPTTPDFVPVGCASGRGESSLGLLLALFALRRRRR
jgi:hypothetical protein